MALVLPRSAKHPPGAARSPHWRAFELAFLKGKSCALCGGRKLLQAHHVRPFHLFPRLELVESNVLPLCEGNPACNCHLLWGHLGNFQSWNETVVFDVEQFALQMRRRP
jgi:hypothetical protein